MNTAQLLLVVSMLVAGLPGCGGDACDDRSGACLTLEVRSDQPLQIDRLAGDIRGATLRFVVDHSGKAIGTPFQYAVTNVPDASGEVAISIAASLSGKLAGIGRAMFVIAPGAHIRVPLALQPASTPTCSDGVRDGDEMGIDCGGDVCGKDLKMGCGLGDTCRVGSRDGGATGDCSKEYPCVNGVCSSCTDTGTCPLGNQRCELGKCKP